MFVNVVQPQSDTPSSLLDPQSLLLYAGFAIIVLGVSLTLSSRPSLQRIFQVRLKDKLSFEFTIPVLVCLIGTAMAFAWLAYDIKGIDELRKTIVELNAKIIDLKANEFVTVQFSLIPQEQASLIYTGNLRCKYKRSDIPTSEQEVGVIRAPKGFEIVLPDIRRGVTITGIRLVDENEKEVGHATQDIVPSYQRIPLAQ